MSQSHEGCHQLRRSGFTLVELLVVLVILGLTSAIVALSLPLGGDSVRRESEHLAARLEKAREHAILSGQTVGVYFEPRAYRFAQRQAGRWQDVDTIAALEPRQLHPQTVLSVNPVGTPIVPPLPGGTPTAQAPAVRFDPHAPLPAMQIALQRGTERAEILLSESGEIALGPIQP